MRRQRSCVPVCLPVVDGAHVQQLRLYNGVDGALVPLEARMKDAVPNGARLVLERGIQPAVDPNLYSF